MPSASQVGARIWDDGPNPLGLTELEVATGVVLDSHVSSGGTRIGSTSGGNRAQEYGAAGQKSPLEVLRGIARELLEKPPCVVAFSGGRDSSALLAVLTDEARRCGLDEPVAVTSRWEDRPDSQEDQWQKHVIDEIGLSEWEILHPGEELDLLGPLATDALSEHGLMWPAPAHALLPLMKRASGGVLVTGEGGDEVFGLWPFGAAWDMLKRNRPIKPRAVAALSLGFAPASLRSWYWTSKYEPYQSWLLEDARHAHELDVAADQGSESIWWARYLQGVVAHRSSLATIVTSEALAAGVGARFRAPFLDPRYAEAVGALAPRTGLGSRTAVMTRLFGSFLSAPILTRVSKATFGAVFWGPHSRQFAREWSGGGLSLDLVDPELLRSAWLEEVPVYGAALSLQAAWLAQSGRPGTP